MSKKHRNWPPAVLAFLAGLGFLGGAAALAQDAPRPTPMPEPLQWTVTAGSSLDATEDSMPIRMPRKQQQYQTGFPLWTLSGLRR